MRLIDATQQGLLHSSKMVSEVYVDDNKVDHLPYRCTLSRLIKEFNYGMYTINSWHNSTRVLRLSKGNPVVMKAVLDEITTAFEVSGHEINGKQYEILKTMVSNLLADEEKLDKLIACTVANIVVQELE